MAHDPWAGVLRVIPDNDDDDVNAGFLVFDEDNAEHQMYLRYLVHSQRFSNQELAFHLNVNISHYQYYRVSSRLVLITSHLSH